MGHLDDLRLAVRGELGVALDVREFGGLLLLEGGGFGELEFLFGGFGGEFGEFLVGAAGAFGAGAGGVAGWHGGWLVVGVLRVEEWWDGRGEER